MMKYFADLPTKAFYALLFCVALLIAAMFFSLDVQRTMLERFHWRDPSFNRWALLQFVPSMYNFSNRIDVSPGDSSLQVNHFPLRAVTFNPKVRQLMAEDDRDYQMTLTSTYRGTKLITVYELYRQPPYLVLGYIHDIP